MSTFQQRGLAPSTEQGEFTVAEAVADIAAVLDELGWGTAYLMGHSWGGHLVFHAAVGIPGRLAGVLSVDSLGAVGDGGVEAFVADLTARLPELESSLPSIPVPFGVLVGELSPIPPSAGIESAERIPGAWSYVEPGAGHLVWYEAPGCLLAAMDRLVAGA